MTYQELSSRAQALAGYLQEHANIGERGLVICHPDIDYVVAVLGCLLAGIVVVPAYPPKTGKGNASNRSIESIVKDCTPAVVLASSDTQVALDQITPWVDPLTLSVNVSEGFPGVHGNWRRLELSADSNSIIQYTSGSTSAPKGVVLTHKNLLHNSHHMSRRCGHNPASVGVSWLPPYHDMGLIGGILQPLYAGFTATLMTPAMFFQKPMRWLAEVDPEIWTGS